MDEVLNSGIYLFTLINHPIQFCMHKILLVSFCKVINVSIDQNTLKLTKICEPILIFGRLNFFFFWDQNIKKLKNLKQKRKRKGKEFMKVFIISLSNNVDFWWFLEKVGKRSHSSVWSSMILSVTESELLLNLINHLRVVLEF